VSRIYADPDPDPETLDVLVDLAGKVSFDTDALQK
jgi:hypothetical protein